jgi:hypothetical protein
LQSAAGTGAGRGTGPPPTVPAAELVEVAGAGAVVVVASAGAVVELGFVDTVVVDVGAAESPPSRQPAARRPAASRSTRAGGAEGRRTATSVGAAPEAAVSVDGVSSIATAVWRIRPELVLGIADRLGEPIDRYVNGSQTWFTETPGDVVLEWRLHPRAAFRRPADVSHHDLWGVVVASLIGNPKLLPDAVWDGLECFAAYGDDIEPGELKAVATEQLGVVPDATGLVDHESIGDAWEKTRGAVSIVALLLEQLGAA